MDERALSSKRVELFGVCSPVAPRRMDVVVSGRTEKTKQCTPKSAGTKENQLSPGMQTHVYIK